MDDDKTIDDWSESFDISSEGVGEEVVETPEEAPEKEPVDEPAEPEETPEEAPADAEDTKEEEPDAEPEPSDDTPEGDGEKEGDGETPEPPTQFTKDDIKAALKEVETERTSYANEIKSTSKEVLDSFYPEGIDRQLRDKDGDPIRSIDDVMNLTNPRTNDNFTEEEAGRWLLEEQQKLNQQIEEVEASAERVAEINVNLKNDATRVVDKYAEILGRYPEVANKAKALYESTLRKDPKTGITVDAPINLLDFYDTFLEPYVNNQQPQAAPPVEPAPTPKPKSDPRDRADLPTTNGNDALSKEEREWADIAKEYQGLRN